MRIAVFDIGGTAIKYGICEDNQLIDIYEIPTNAQLGGAHIIDTIDRILAKQNNYDAVGISTAGQVNFDEGSIIYANRNIPNYTGMQLKSHFELKFKVPVVIENDVNSAAIGEAVYGAGKAHSNFLCLTYGTGIGGAIIEEKKIYHGASFSAGEFGAIITHGDMHPEDTEDYFAGSYERYASTSALIRTVSTYDKTISNGKQLFDRINEPEIKRIVDAWIQEIILGLTTIIHIFNPTCIILGGGIMAQSYIIDGIRTKIKQRIMPNFRSIEILPAKLENHAGLLGIYHIAKEYVTN